MTILTIMILTLLTNVNDNKYWENLSEVEKNIFLQAANIPENVVELYQDDFVLSDDDITIKLLEYLTSIQTDVDTKAFKFYLFNKVVTSADGSLLEVLPKYILKMVVSDIRYVFDYFKVNAHIRDAYSMLLGTEFYFKECDSSSLPYTFNQFKEKIKSTLNSCEYDKVMLVFFTNIQNHMNNMD